MLQLSQEDGINVYIRDAQYLLDQLWKMYIISYQQIIKL